MKKIFFIIFFIFQLINIYHAENKIVFLDINFVLTNCVKGKTILKKLDIIKKKNLEILKKDETLLLNEENDIKKKRNIISQEEFNSKVKKFKTKINEFNNKKNLLTNEFNTKKEEEINKLLRSINPIIQEYVKNNSISIVFDKKNVLIGKTDYDITNEILKNVNSKLN